MRVFDVDGGAESADVARDVVGEDYAAHGGFAGAGFSHEEDFAFAVVGGEGGGFGGHGGWAIGVGGERVEGERVEGAMGGEEIRQRPPRVRSWSMQ